jgi:hypothetical protein
MPCAFHEAHFVAREAATKVAQTSKSAVSRISKSAGHRNSTVLPTWKSATQQVWKPALQVEAAHANNVEKKDYPGFTAVMMLRLAAVGLKSKVVKPVSVK